MRNFIISSILILVFITTIIQKNVYIELSLEVWTFVKDKETLRRAAQQVMEQVDKALTNSLQNTSSGNRQQGMDRKDCLCL